MGTIGLRDVNDDWRERDRLRGGALVRAWGDYLGRIPWQFSATLTFDPMRVFPVSRDMASEEAFWWLCLVACLCRRPVGWAYVVERSRNGLWHAHALMVGAGRPNRRTLEGVWRMRNGYAVIKSVHSVKRVSLYTTKQATDGEVVLSDTMTLTRFKTLASDIVVPLVAEVE
jgi:hypothetical protein